MSTQYIFVPGKIRWAKGLNEIDPEYHTYNAQLWVSPSEKDRVEGAGCQAKFKPDGDGFLFKVKKDSKRLVKKNNELIEVDASPPEVFLSDPEGKRVDLDPKTVGNGSDVTVKLELYDTKKGGKGTRLVAVRVEYLIEFTPNEVIGGEDMPF